MVTDAVNAKPVFASETKEVLFIVVLITNTTKGSFIFIAGFCNRKVNIINARNQRIRFEGDQRKIILWGNSIVT
jgi:hypothetical protein